MQSDNEKLQRLSRVLNYHFSNIELLQAAVSHRSMGVVNNERLEFLGDSVLNFTVASELYQRFPKAREGELTRMRSLLVREETLADIARKFGLGNYLNLGVGELKSGGFERASILADALEAIMGSIYLDGGLENCQKRILGWYETHLNGLLPGVIQKDSKTQLQEYCQARQLSLPEYQIIEISGDPHNPIFRMQCTINELKLTSIGIDNSRRKAEQAAAQTVLERLKRE